VLERVKVVLLWWGLELRMDHGLFRVLGLKYGNGSPYGFKIFNF